MAAGIIISIFLIIVLLAAFVVFLVLYLRERNKKDPAPPVGINNAKFALKTDTEVEASWDSTQPNNRVTLYANTKPISIGSNGQPNAAEGVVHSVTVDGNSVKSVSIGGLTIDTRYYLALVAFNTLVDTVNDTIYTSTTLQGEFTIEHDSEKAIILGSNQTTVSLGKPEKASLDDVWEYDAGQFGGTPLFTLFSKAVSNTPETVLYNNSGTLAAESLSTLMNDKKLDTAQWEYTTENKWCLKSNTSLCMSVATAGAPTTIQVQASTTGFNQKWSNKPTT